MQGFRAPIIELLETTLTSRLQYSFRNERMVQNVSGRHDQGVAKRFSRFLYDKYFPREHLVDTVNLSLVFLFDRKFRLRGARSDIHDRWFLVSRDTWYLGYPGQGLA
jgi:hypothetical protein